MYMKVHLLTYCLYLQKIFTGMGKERQEVPESGTAMKSRKTWGGRTWESSVEGSGKAGGKLQRSFIYGAAFSLRREVHDAGQGAVPEQRLSAAAEILYRTGRNSFSDTVRQREAEACMLSLFPRAAEGLCAGLAAYWTVMR